VVRSPLSGISRRLRLASILVDEAFGGLYVKTDISDVNLSDDRSRVAAKP
jgi:hypothetical protein